MKPPSLLWRHRRVPFLFLAGAALLPVRELRAQDPGGGAVVDLGRMARQAQSAFESERIRRLPWAWGESPRPCDEIVGRFCYWSDARDDWKPRPESPETAAARDRLLARLAEAAASLPGDGWLAGQRVRYLVEAGRTAEAVAMARSCGTARDWCRALEGYALHAAGDFAAAEAPFRAALAAMPAAERGRWTDVQLLLDPELRRVWRELGESERPAFAERLWWLADPLWSVPGNERRTEHFARLVLDRLLVDARSPYDVRWGADLRELTVRYGWPAGWERARPRTGALGDGGRPGVVGHDPPGARRFEPPADAFLAPAEAAPEAWPLDPEGARATYAPSYADSVQDLGHQLARFRRGDDALVVAAYELGGLPADTRGEAALTVAESPGEPAATAIAQGTRGAMAVEAPWRPSVVSLEARAPGARVAARARYGLDLPERPGPLSDILLLARPDPLPTSVEEAVPRARPSALVSPRERLGVYFEIYPPAGAESVDVAIALRDERRGFWRGLAAAFGGRGRAGEVAMAWSEEMEPGAPFHPRALAVTLPDLAPGKYTLVLDIAFRSGSAPASARSERSIEVR